MKAAVFEYARVEEVAQALEHLSELGGDAKLLAGGQSLVPMMAMRLARPAWLIDIDRVASLKAHRFHATHVHIGAGTRQKTVEHSAEFAAALPLLRKALKWVGHEQTRNRGTVGGSVAYADPSAEIPLTALVLDGVMHLQSKARGTRQVRASDFFQGPMFTAIQEDECLTAVDLPVWQGAHVGSAFEETAIRHGDFAMASAACQLQTDGQGHLTRISMGLGGVDGTPLAFAELGSQMLGQVVTPALAREVASQAAARCNPGSDMHAQAPYRKHLAARLLERVLIQSAQDAAAATQKA
jgi:CO/xanthine dehydrogenase FAD-binding subunit